MPAKDGIEPSALQLKAQHVAELFASTCGAELLQKKTFVQKVISL